MLVKMVSSPLSHPFVPATQNPGTIAPIEREIRDLANGLQSVKDEQEYIVLRERVHRNTAESTNDRVKWWSIIQAIVLFAVVAWQIYYLKVSHSSCVACSQANVVHSHSLKSSARFDPVFMHPCISSKFAAPA